MPHQNIKDIITIQDINPNLKYKLYKFYEVGILGTGYKAQPYIDVSKIVNLESSEALSAKNEILSLLGSTKKVIQAYLGGYIPEDLENRKTVNYFVWRRNKFIPKNVIDSWTQQNHVGDWIYKNGLCDASWKSVDFLVSPNKSVNSDTKLLDWSTMYQEGEWKENTPFLKRWLEKINIFEKIGRISVFKNNPNFKVGIHRDSPFSPSKDHTLLIQFNPNRPWFIYDEVSKEKIYVKSQAYVFNSQDLHGVDAENDEQVTLRIFGTFKPEICEMLDLKEGFIWHPKYPSSEKIKDIKIYEPDERP
jgi:hypothetical protein